ncbi:MAG TPA: carboxypeptidase-like regulatory domain-containing protein, partial [Planctomycetota bacterium]|nr:carboxypeptidase-like regulatory domain-containing protein [Planctomycetota bacterium]
METLSEAPAEALPIRGAAELHHVAGRVVDWDGAPLPGVRVRAAPIEASGDEEPASALSGAEGAFRLEGLGAGLLVLTAKKEGLRTVVLRDVRAGREDLVIVLRAPTGVEGRVLDAETGAPVPRFRVDVFREGWADRASMRMPFSSRSFESEDGSFGFTDVDEPRFELEVSAPGHLPERAGPFELSPSEMLRGTEVRLRPGMIVRGTVVDGETGAPVASARVYHQRMDDPYRDGSSTTGEDGGFEVTCDSPGVRLRVRHDSYVDAATEPLGRKGERSVEGLVIRLQRGGALDGYVPRRDGTPMASGMAYASPTGAWSGEFLVRYPKFTRTDGAGYFRIEGLAPGSHTVEVTLTQSAVQENDEPRRRTLRTEAEVEAGRTTR